MNLSNSNRQGIENLSSNYVSYTVVNFVEVRMGRKGSKEKQRKQSMRQVIKWWDTSKEKKILEDTMNDGFCTRQYLGLTTRGWEH